MSVRLLFFSNFSKNIFEKALSNVVVKKVDLRNFSRKLSNKDDSYKPVKPRKNTNEGKPVLSINSPFKFILFLIALTLSIKNCNYLLFTPLSIQGNRPITQFCELLEQSRYHIMDL